MRVSLHQPGDRIVPHFWRNEAYLRQEFARMGAAVLRRDGQDAANRLEALLERERPGPEELQTARQNVAASAALLPITPEMAWTVPQLLKRVGLVSPGVLSTSGALRAVIRMPEADELFAKAFADSGFLSCDRAIEHARWKYDFSEMMAKHHEGSAWQVLEQCRLLLTQHYTKQPVDWEAVLIELQTLVSWFPELRTIHLLEQLYGRLYVLHMKSVLVVQHWLDWRAGMGEALPESSVSAPFAAMSFELQGVHHA